MRISFKCDIDGYQVQLVALSRRHSADGLQGYTKDVLVGHQHRELAKTTREDPSDAGVLKHHR